MGSLPKHPTKIKKNDDLRVKFFDGRKPDSADGSPVLRQREKRIKRTPGRRLSTISGQTLITSIFSPRTDSSGEDSSISTLEQRENYVKNEDVDSFSTPKGATK